MLIAIASGSDKFFIVDTMDRTVSGRVDASTLPGGLAVDVMMEQKVLPLR